jgi:uncharacterized membrane protein YgdD (TMEM256/DUF423 family)
MNTDLARNISGALGFLGILLGAFGAHVLRAVLEQLGTTPAWQTAVLYHLLSAVALLVLSGMRPFPKLSFLFLLIGVLIFSGSLYLLAVTNIRWLGALTPFGGVGMLLGWLGIAVGRSKQ